MRHHEAFDLPEFVAGLKKRNPGQPEFVKAVEEAMGDVGAFIADKPEVRRWQIVPRIAEPDRVISVVWQDDKGAICVQRGWRVLTPGKK